MKRFIIFLCVLAAGFSVIGQPVMKISASEHNFGTFKADAGRQTFDFIVTNTGNAPLLIQNIATSCGCTTPQWTQEPIPAGGKGKITAIYDPTGRYGEKFDKTLSVYTNSKPEIVVLHITGEVLPRELSIEEQFTFPVDSIRFESNHLAFTNIKKTEKKIRVMQLINTSKKPVKVEFEQLPPHLSLKSNPETLKPGQKGIIEGTYDATKSSGWGNLNDLAKIKLNGVTQENVYYYISANLVEDFSQMTKEQLENAPVFKLAATTVDIGKVPGSVAREVEFKYVNAGKSDLIFRDVRSTCGCTAVQQGPQTDKPGQAGSIKAVFNTGTYNGPQTKLNYVHTNDPKNSEVVLTLTAQVEQAGTTK